MKSYILSSNSNVHSLNYVLWGARGHGKVCRECVDVHYLCKPIAMFDNDPSIVSPYPDLPLLHGSEFESWSKKHENCGFIVAIGGPNGKVRENISKMMIDCGLVPISFIHPKTSISSDFDIPNGLQIMAGSNIGPNVSIGDYTIINHMANIDHDDTLGKGCFVAPGATLCGEIILSDYVFIGAGAVILPRLKIGKNSIIGAGSVVTKDVPENTIVLGNPAHFYKHI